MVLCDFIGAKVEYDGTEVTIKFVGQDNGYVYFAFYKEGELVVFNSNKVSVEIEYVHRPALRGKTTFIGRTLINAIWTDDEGKLVKSGKTKSLEVNLADVRLYKQKKEAP